MNVELFGRRVAVLLVVLAWGALASPAGATIGDASLFVAGANSTPTHWDIPIGVPTTVELRGVSTADVGGPLPAALTVWVKSSDFGNTMLTAMRIGVSSDYTFDYMPPAFACGTTVVAYLTLGYEANNDLADDGIANGSGTAASGLRFIDGNGMPIDCEPVSLGPETWGRLKALYR